MSNVLARVLIFINLRGVELGVGPGEGVRYYKELRIRLDVKVRVRARILVIGLDLEGFFCILRLLVSPMVVGGGCVPLPLPLPILFEIPHTPTPILFEIPPYSFLFFVFTPLCMSSLQAGSRALLYRCHSGRLHVRDRGSSPGSP